jgi:hypothetical protein
LVLLQHILNNLMVLFVRHSIHISHMVLHQLNQITMVLLRSMLYNHGRI